MKDEQETYAERLRNAEWRLDGATRNHQALEREVAQIDNRFKKMTASPDFQAWLLGLFDVSMEERRRLEKEKIDAKNRDTDVQEAVNRAYADASQRQAVAEKLGAMDKVSKANPLFKECPVASGNPESYSAAVGGLIANVKEPEVTEKAERLAAELRKFYSVEYIDGGVRASIKTGEWITVVHPFIEANTLEDCVAYIKGYFAQVKSDRASAQVNTADYSLSPRQALGEAKAAFRGGVMYLNRVLDGLDKDSHAARTIIGSVLDGLNAPLQKLDSVNIL